MKNSRVKRAAVLLTAIALLLAAAVGGTVAFLVASTESVVNTFTPTDVDIEIIEYFNGNLKRTVQIKNNGNIPAYIRARVVITWQDEAGNVYPQKPEVENGDYTGDYTIEWGNGFWTAFETDVTTYYQLPVEPHNSTDYLIIECKPVEGKAPEGYNLHVEVLAQAIQAIPSNVVTDRWGVKLGTITIDGEEFVAIVN